MDSDKKAPPREGGAPCAECALRRGPERGRGLLPHGNLMAAEDSDHINLRSYKCADCGSVLSRNSLSQTWF